MSKRVKGKIKVPGAAPSYTADRTSGTGIKVRAIETGYFGDERKREGDVFEIDDEKQFSKRWMEKVDKTTPNKTTSAPEALAKQMTAESAKKSGRTKGDDPLN